MHGDKCALNKPLLLIGDGHILKTLKKEIEKHRLEMSSRSKEDLSTIIMNLIKTSPLEKILKNGKKFCYRSTSLK